VERAGGGATRVHARLIASTRFDLEAAVRKGRFREDLFRRVCGARVAIPALRARPEDIPVLAEIFLRQACAVLRRRTPRITRGALDRLIRHDWPGNVRELRDTIERMAMGAGRRTLEVSDLPAHLRSVAEGGTLAVYVGMTVAEAERHLIEATLRHTGGDRPRAAAILGIGLRTLYRKVPSTSRRRRPRTNPGSRPGR